VLCNNQGNPRIHSTHFHFVSMYRTRLGRIHLPSRHLFRRHLSRGHLSLVHVSSRHLFSRHLSRVHLPSRHLSLRNLSQVDFQLKRKRRRKERSSSDARVDVYRSSVFQWEISRCMRSVSISAKISVHKLMWDTGIPDGVGRWDNSICGMM